METFLDMILIAGMLLLGIFVILTLDQDPKARFKRVRWMVVFTWFLSLGTIIGVVLGFTLAPTPFTQTGDLSAIVFDLLLALVFIGGGIGIWLKNRFGLALWLIGIIWQVSSYAVSHMKDMSALHIIQSPLATFIFFLLAAVICFLDGRKLWDQWRR